MRLIIVDVETSGGEPSCVIETGLVDMNLGDSRPLTYDSQLWLPTVPITSGARGVHHIRDDEFLSHHKPFDKYYLASLNADFLVAHNAKHEAEYIERGEDQHWLCTYKITRRLFPELESYSLQFLKYELKLESLGMRFELTLPAHRAGPDAYVTAFLFLALMNEYNEKIGTDTFKMLNEFAQWSAEPVLLHRCHLKKHKGKLWSEVPYDYLQWILRPHDEPFDEDIVHTAKYWVEQKRKAIGVR